MYYLKYRPQTIAELDNKNIRESLGAALLENRFAHAYLLIGPKGTGKTTTARLIAKVLNCTQRKKGEEPCNDCESCRAISAGTSLDVIEMDAASHTGVDDIRDIREKAKLSPTTSRFKVYIIDEVHMLSTSAFNALLKILEEPPTHVTFVLATTEVSKIPATVASRCLVYNFGQTTKEDVVKKLAKIKKEENLKVDEGVLAQIAEAAGSSHRDAQKLLEQVSMGGVSDVSFLTPNVAMDDAEKILKAMENRETKEAIELVNKFVKADVKVRDLISGLVNLLREKLLAGEGDREETVDLITRLIEANAMLRDSPVAQLPLEMTILEYCENGKKRKGRDEKLDEEVRNGELGKEARSEKLDWEVRSEKVIDREILPLDPASHVSLPTSDVVARWSEILAATKPLNHSLVAFLRASKPVELNGDSLTLEVFYKFHKEKLEEKKNREILEKVVSGIMGRDIRIRFVLAEKIK